MTALVTAVDPRTGNPAASYPAATVEDVAVGARAAMEAFRSPRLRDRDVRVALLRDIARRLRDKRDLLVATCEAETGLPAQRLHTELERTAVQLERFAAVVAAGHYLEPAIDVARADWSPVPRPDLRRINVPIGPVAVFGASNMPFAFSTAGGDTASALAAGCPVLVKGHPSHPGTGVLVAREVADAVAAAGLPDGVFVHLLAADLEVAEALVDAPEVAAIGFTGSLAAGRSIHDRAAARPVPIPVFAEMGSINPVVLTAAAAATRGREIAAEVVAVVRDFGGQYCTKPGIVLVPRTADGDSFVAAVRDGLAESEPAVLLNAGICAGLAGKVRRLRDAGYAASDAADAANGAGSRFQPTACEADAAALANAPELREEHFGPVVILLRYGDDAELLRALTALEGQLTATIHAEPGEDVIAIVEALTERVGRLVFNGSPVGVAVTHAQHHGGPYPASTAPAFTSVGSLAIRRFLRPIAYQNAPAELLPPELRDENRLGLWRLVNGELTRDPVVPAG